MEHMKRCAWCEKTNELKWHCALQSRNKQIDEWYAIVALCTKCCPGEFSMLEGKIREFCQMIAMTRDTKELMAKYPQRDWAKEKHWLENRIKNYVNEHKI